MNAPHRRSGAAAPPTGGDAAGAGRNRPPTRGRGPRPGTLLRLALAGSRTDTLRVILTSVSAALATVAMLAAATVSAVRGSSGADGGVPGWAGRYTNQLLVEPGLRPGVALALLLLCIPVLALAAQCARLGAPARDRRLAAMRLAGATPRQATAVAVAETGVAALLGSGAGLAAYLVGRHLLHRPGPDGRLPLPTDTLPAPWLLVTVTLVLPALAVPVTALLLRRVTVTPFGVTRRVRIRPPRPWPGLLIVPAVALIAAVLPAGRAVERAGGAVPTAVYPLVFFGAGLLATVGVVAGTGWISHTCGRILRRLARRPTALLAAGRLMSDPWSGSRVLAALLAAVLFGAGAAAVRELISAQLSADHLMQLRVDDALGQSTAGAFDDSFYMRAMDLVDAAVTVGVLIAAAGLLITVAEGIVSRRREYAALVATGVPRGVLARTVLWRTMAPAVAAVAVALVVGTALVRGVGREVLSGGMGVTMCQAPDPVRCDDPATAAQYTRYVEIPQVTVPVDVAWGQLAALGATAVGAVLVTTLVGLLFLRASTVVEELRTT